MSSRRKWRWSSERYSGSAKSGLASCWRWVRMLGLATELSKRALNAADGRSQTHSRRWSAQTAITRRRFVLSRALVRSSRGVSAASTDHKARSKDDLARTAADPGRGSTQRRLSRSWLLGEDPAN